MELVQIVMKKYGMPEGQVKALLGIIFKRCRNKLSPADFAKIKAVLPDVEAWIKMAPQMDNIPINSTPAGRMLTEVFEYFEKKGGKALKDLVDFSVYTQKTDSDKRVWG